MILRRNLIIPIFNYKLSVIIFDEEDWDKVSQYSNSGTKLKGFVNYKPGEARVFIGSQFGSTIVHESEHIKNLIWDWIGYTPQPNNDEVDSYLITYIYNKITDVFYKHRDLKQC